MSSPNPHADIDIIAHDVSDRHLLCQFVQLQSSGAADAAMRTLVERHSPLVLGVCRRALGGDADAEDAAQAVFLVLWKKAARLTSESIAPWLHRTAILICRNAKRSRRVRQLHEQRTAVMSTQEPSTEGIDWAEVRAVLDVEIDQLPEKYRNPLIQFHLEGRTVEEIATQSGAPVSTVWTWLVRARELLAGRLTRRGISIGAALLATGLSSVAQAGTVPPTFAGTTMTAAKLFGAGNLAVAGELSSSTSALAYELLKVTFWTPLKTATAAVMACLGAGAVTVGVLLIGSAETIPPPKPAEPAQVVDNTPANDALAGEQRGAEPALDEEPADAPIPRQNEANPQFGGVDGIVRFEGQVPPIPPLLLNKLNQEMADPSLVLDPESRGVANVVIYLRKSPLGSPLPGFTTAIKKRVVDNQSSVYVPHVFVAQAGQTIVFKNASSFAINVHTNPVRNAAAKFLVTPNNRIGSGISFAESETIPVKIVDDIHATASCYALVLDHPYGAVTDPSGRFYIPHLPVGTHSFRVWHERAGYLQRDYSITVTGGETTTLPPLVIPIDRLRKR